jgi:CheY-like chemotaxis protein
MTLLVEDDPLQREVFA